MATETPSPPVRSKSWGFTWNNPRDSWADDLLAVIRNAGASKWVFQKEVGENGTPHIQGCFQFSAQRTASSWQPQFILELGASPHWECVRNWKKMAAYCCKSDTAVGDSVASEAKWRRVSPVDLWREVGAAQWQKDIIAITLTEANNRTVHWYWEPDGCTGKSLLVRHLMLTQERVFLLGGKSSDLLHAVAGMAEKGVEPRVVFWDIPRAQTVPDYSGVEALKNATFFSPKYESGMVILSHYPHVFVFSNYAPDESKLSADRWHIVRIGIPDGVGDSAGGVIGTSGTGV